MFDPNIHLMKIGQGENAKEYLPVQWRLVWFREQCPNGTIDIEEVVVDLDREVEEEAYVWNNEKKRKEKIMKRAKGYARFKAIVTNGTGGRATGTKSENAASFPDYVEKAETGAIGRALAGLGFGTQFTGDEFDEAHRIVDSPVTRPSDVEKIKGEWAAAYHIADQQIGDRWPKYLVHILGTPVADPDLTAAQLERATKDIEQQRQKARAIAS